MVPGIKKCQVPNNSFDRANLDGTIFSLDQEPVLILCIESLGRKQCFALQTD